jgi:hypothetical protein
MMPSSAKPRNASRMTIRCLTGAPVFSFFIFEVPFYEYQGIIERKRLILFSEEKLFQMVYEVIARRFM